MKYKTPLQKYRLKQQKKLEKYLKPGRPKQAREE